MWQWSGSAPTTRPGTPRRTLELAVLGPGTPARLALSRPGGQPLGGGVDSGGTGPGPALPKLPATAGTAVIVFGHDNCLPRIPAYTPRPAPARKAPWPQMMSRATFRDSSA